MEIQRESLTVPITQRAAEVLWEDLSKHYSPFLHGNRGDVRSGLGLDRIDGSIFYGGEIFLTEGSQFLYYKISENSDAVEAGTIIAGDEGLQIFSGFKEKIRDSILAGKKEKTSWNPIPVINQRFELIKEEAERLQVEEREIEAAFIMKDDRLRSLLKKIQKRGCCFQDELLESPTDMETPSMLTQLETLGLITKEFFIFCSKTGQQISRVNSLAALEDARVHGFKCFSCGRLISEERIAPQVKCSALGEKFSQANYWLALHVISVLDDMEMSIDNIYYKTEKDNRNFDMFMNTLDGLFMFEVKDEPLRLEEIFMFLSSVNFYKPTHAILISANMVPLEVRMYLKNYRGEARVALVEGLDELETYLGQAFMHKQEVYLEQIFRNFRKETRFNFNDLFKEKFFMGKDMLIIPTPMPSVIEVKKTEVIEEPLQKMDEFTEVLPGEDLEEVTPEEEEVPEVMETIEMSPDLTTELPVSEVMANVEALIKEEEMTEPVLPDEEEKSLPVEEKKEHSVEQPFEFMESIPSEILPIEEFPPSADTSEEDLEGAARDTIARLESEGIVGNYDLMEKELAKLEKISSYKTAIFDGSGLLIMDNLGMQADGESIAAYSSVILDSIQNALADSGMEEAHSIHLEGGARRIKLFPGKDVNIIAYEERKSSEIEDESSALPGEMVLREAIMKKVLDDLMRVDGIEGGVIAGQDGLVIEANIPSEMDADSLGLLSSLTVTENDKYLKALLESTPKQMLIKMNQVFYNFIPIENEALLITCLDPGIPREVWQSRLPQSAMMLKSALS